MAMTRVVDDIAKEDVVDQNIKTAFGDDKDLNIKDPTTYALESQYGSMVFRQIIPGYYETHLAITKGTSGANSKKLIRNGFHYMFINTDAYVIIGRIDSDNAGMIAMLPHLLGYTLTDDGNAKLFKTKLRNWANGYGLATSLFAMRAAGNTAKADKLLASTK